MVCQNYCWECDEFYRVGHSPDCSEHGEGLAEAMHLPHFASLAFFDSPSQWAIFLDVQQLRSWTNGAGLGNGVRRLPAPRWVGTSTARQSTCGSACSVVRLFPLFQGAGGSRGSHIRLRGGTR